MSESVKQAAEEKDAHPKARAERFRLTGEPLKAGTDTDDDRSPAEKTFGTTESSAAVIQHDAGQLDGGHPGFHSSKKSKGKK